MRENTSNTQPAPSSGAPGLPDSATLTLTNHSTVNPSPLLAPAPAAVPAAGHHTQRPDALLLRTAEFVERIEARIDPLGTQRRRMAQAARTHKPWKPSRLNAMRHSRKCRICNHPRREDIESDYLAWLDPRHLAYCYRLRNDSSIYRHARALGLDKKRRQNLRGALEAILQKAHSATITANGVVSAVRAYASLDDRFGWVEPTRHIVITHVNSVASAQPSPAPRQHRFAPRPALRPGKRNARRTSGESKRALRRNSSRKTPISNRLANRQTGSKSK
jgi:hypothetical protein